MGRRTGLLRSLVPEFLFVPGTQRPLSRGSFRSTRASGARHRPRVAEEIGRALPRAGMAEVGVDGARLEPARDRFLSGAGRKAAERLEDLPHQRRGAAAPRRSWPGLRGRCGIRASSGERIDLADSLLSRINSLLARIKFPVVVELIPCSVPQGISSRRFAND